MTYNELLTKILGIDVMIPNCEGLICKGNSCDRCEYKKFWNSEVDMAKIYANISSDTALAKALLNSIYDAHYMKTCYADTDNVQIEEAFKKASAQPVMWATKNVETWIEVPSKIINTSFHSVAEILDDATVHGIDFKYEGGKYYYKER